MPYAPAPSPVQSQHVYPYYTPAYPGNQPQSAAYAYPSPVYNTQEPQPQPYQRHNAAAQYSSNGYTSPQVAMGPPIRLGFGDQQGTDGNSYPLNHHGPETSAVGYPATTFYPQGSSYSPQSSLHGSSNQQRRGRGAFRSRGRANSAGPSHNYNHKTQVAPAVPSFGNPLPTKPPAPREEAKKIRKKRRRVNQLGLTPKIDVDLSSSEADDDEEELKLGTAINGSGAASQELKFTYKGLTSTLQSAADIASWIEERKKRFPTAARKAEKLVRLEKLRQEREENKKLWKTDRTVKKHKNSSEKDEGSAKQAKERAAAEKSRLKVEKLRRKLEKEERRAARAELKTLKRHAPNGADEDQSRETKRKREHRESDTPSIDDRDHRSLRAGSSHSLAGKELGESSTLVEADPMARNDKQLQEDEAALNAEAKDIEPSSLFPDPLIPTSQTTLPEQEVEPKSKAEPTIFGESTRTRQMPGQRALDDHSIPDTSTLIKQEEPESSISASSPDATSFSDVSSDDSDDETSSSGSSSSDSDADAQTPATVPSRRLKPQRVAPPKRNSQQDKAICREFLRFGRCKRGKKCRWRHALPDRGPRNAERSVLSRPERKSLHQRLIEQEVEKEKAEKRSIDQRKHGPDNNTQTTAA
ncbi:MAG: hypothetical protein Q9219_002569 [cf. Caloplaca sp. 3 TL-2023]